MTNEEISKWLMNLKEDIGKTQYQSLWDYAEALDEEFSNPNEQKSKLGLISRQAVKDWLAKWEGYIDSDIIARMQYRVIDIPSAPERNRGHWLHKKIISSNSEIGFFSLPECMCSECNIMIVHETNFCPNCGADMRGECIYKTDFDGTYVCYIDGYEIQDNACETCDRKVVDGN